MTAQPINPPIGSATIIPNSAPAINAMACSLGAFIVPFAKERLFVDDARVGLLSLVFLGVNAVLAYRAEASLGEQIDLLRGEAPEEVDITKASSGL